MQERRAVGSGRNRSCNRPQGECDRARRIPDTYSLPDISYIVCIAESIRVESWVLVIASKLEPATQARSKLVLLHFPTSAAFAVLVNSGDSRLSGDLSPGLPRGTTCAIGGYPARPEAVGRPFRQPASGR